MGITARQSTARTFIVGPVLDADGVAVTDGVIADFKIAKNGAAPAAFDGSATLTHRHTGFYSLAATATDLDTVGQAEVTIDDTVNTCPMKEITVIEEPIYDALFAASANAFSGAAGSTTLTALASGSITAAVVATGAIDADAIADNAIDAGAIADNAITAAKIADGAIDEATFATTAGSFRALGIIDQGTAQAVTSNTVQLRAAAGFGDNELVGCIIWLPGQAPREVLSNVGATDTVTVDPFTTAPTGTPYYTLFAGPPAPVTLPTVNATQWGGVNVTGMPMPTYTQPAGFLAATFPGGTVANTTNITAGTITNLTNAPTAGDLTATMKTSVETAVENRIVANHLDHLLAADYDPASKPGVATALLNELIGSDAGVSQFTANSLELAPTGGSAPTVTEIRQEMDSNSTQLAAIVADTSELQTDWVNGGRLDLLIDAVKAKTDLIPASPAAVGSAMTLTSGERDAVAAALLDLAAGVETNRTLRQALRIMLAALAGKTSGMGTTTGTIRDTNDTVDRIVATLDADGNRSSVTLNAS
jgi:hypothetical protein